MVDRRVAGASLLVLAGIVIAVVITSPGSLSFVDSDRGCDWQVLEINGETFGSMDELAAAAEANGRSLEELQDHGEFRVRDGVVEVRGHDCGVKESG